MANLWRNLWTDDCGALIATEFLFVVTLLVIGIIVGLASVRNAVVTELAELANAILALSEGYSFAGISGCCAATDGSQTIDIPGTITPPTCTPATSVSVIDVTPCS